MNCLSSRVLLEGEVENPRYEISLPSFLLSLGKSERVHIACKKQDPFLKVLFLSSSSFFYYIQTVQPPSNFGNLFWAQADKMVENILHNHSTLQRAMVSLNVVNNAERA